jgi:hypothetical protein
MPADAKAKFRTKTRTEGAETVATCPALTTRTRALTLSFLASLYALTMQSLHSLHARFL